MAVGPIFFYNGFYTPYYSPSIARYLKAEECPVDLSIFMRGRSDIGRGLSYAMFMGMAPGLRACSYSVGGTATHTDHITVCRRASLKEHTGCGGGNLGELGS